MYTQSFYRTKLLHFETRSVCAYVARTQCFSNSHTSLEFILSSSRTECENVALGGVDTSFFSLFSTKKCVFLLFFGYFYAKIPGWVRGLTFFKGLCAQIGRNFTTIEPLSVDFRLSTGAEAHFNVIFGARIVPKSVYLSIA